MNVMKEMAWLSPLLWVLSACSSEALPDIGAKADPGDDSPTVDSGDDSPTAEGNSATVQEVLGDGNAFELAVVFEPTSARSATDLGFNPVRPGELWVVMRELDFADRPCNQVRPDARACAALEGSVAIIAGADTSSPSARVVKDSNAWHFMRRPPAIAFGQDDTFATCGEARTGNYDDAPADFMGPTLWSSDPEIFGPHGPGGNGSHLDMLHATPYCMGIAHERDNIYWLFNGDIGALDRYDFHEPHEPGGEDHSDGEASRWAIGEFERVAGVPSHLVYDASGASVYVADTARGRIVRINPDTGVFERTAPTPDVQMDVIDVMAVTVEEVVGQGVLEAPSGLALDRGILYVSDHETSRILAFDLQGRQVGQLDTGLPRGSLAGIAIGPDRALYLADMRTSRVSRIEPR